MIVQDQDSGPRLTNSIGWLTLLTVPSFTRFEALEVKSKSGSAKISGTLISLGGAMMLTFYKGSALTQTTTTATSSPASSSGGHIRQQAGEHGTVRWVLGSVSMLANVVGFALWLLLQRKFTRKYPAVYSATAFMSLFSFVQAGALALSIQRTSLAVWALRGTVEIATVVYCVRRTHVLLSFSYSCMHSADSIEMADAERVSNVSGARACRA